MKGKINKVDSSLNDDRTMLSIDSIEAHAYGANEYLLSEKEEIKCSNIMKR